MTINKQYDKSFEIDPQENDTPMYENIVSSALSLDNDNTNPWGSQRAT